MRFNFAPVVLYAALLGLGFTVSPWFFLVMIICVALGEWAGR